MPLRLSPSPIALWATREPDLTNPYYVTLTGALGNLLKQAGCTFILAGSQQLPTKQLTDIRNMIQRGVKVLFIDSVDPTAIVPAFKDANSANIPVVTLIRPPEQHLSQVR